MKRNAHSLARLPRLSVFVVSAVLAALAGSAPAMAQPNEPAREPARDKDQDATPDRAGRIRVSEPPSQSPVELSAIQGILAVQQIDGWLLYDNVGENPLAMELVAPSDMPKRKWFYWIPAEGQPTALVHETDAPLFAQVPGETTTYTAQDELKAGLGKLLKGAKRVAMEYEPKVPERSAVDAGTLALVRQARATVVPSAELAQLTKAQWGPSGRLSHYVAVHHLTKLREEAVAMITEKLKANQPVTELDVQNLLDTGYRIRGLVGAKPSVAVGANTANPQYRASSASSRQIRLGDLIVLRLAGRVGGQERSIFASTTWIVYVGQAVPPQLTSMFAAAANARDAAIATMADRVRRRRAVKGFEIDRRVRTILSDAGFTKNILHRTGHAMDSQLYGAGASLDDSVKSRDSRNLVTGAGFSVAPGLYIPGQLGIRAEANVYIGASGIEVTTPLQPRIIPLLAAQQPAARTRQPAGNERVATSDTP